MKDNIALIDMDDTIVDYTNSINKEICNIYSNGNQENYNYEREYPQHVKNLINHIRNANGFWSNLPVLKEGMDVLFALKESGFDIHILTKGPFSSKNAWTEKFEWCEKNLSPTLGRLGRDYGLTITSDKSLVYGKILFDDYNPYCEKWLKWRTRGLVIQLKNRLNKDWIHPNVVKYDGKNMDEIKQRIKERIDSGQSD